MPPKSRGGSGGLSRRAALALIGGGGLLGISASGAFDQVGAQRPFDLAVDDDNALLGIETFGPIEVTQSDVTVDVMELHNRFPDAVFDSVSVTTDSSILSISDPLERGETLANDERLTVRGRVESDRSRTANVELTITVSGSSERIETTRTITVAVDLRGQLPEGCPVSLDISVSVGDDALGEQTSDGDLSLTNEEVDGSVTTTAGSGGSLDIRNTTITGDVIADGDISLRNATVGGDVRTREDSEGTISLENTTVGGSIVGDSDVTSRNSNVDGDLRTREDSEGAITVRGQRTTPATVVGSVVGDGDVEIIAAQIGGEVQTRSGSEGSITITNATVCRAIDADDDLTITNAEVGAVTADGDIQIKPNSTVFGTVNASNNVTLSRNATVKGDINASGDVTVDGTVEGGVFAGGTVDGSGTINGNDPRPSSENGNGGGQGR
ncbi:hypothetical protein EGH24_10090 [Halonotius terrestris]|uniref:Uncharacterized protein n=1 Tax=Halonotius terrestris TaxID=2487750 RepID=A0A8J8P7V0_9EURY|nr:polymer-forming cytoskeletal protein [Halonotius terrestris]TQQ79832.1 hypothetical protein EGH24_10090 [Halonotius terrestris]